MFGQIQQILTMQLIPRYNNEPFKKKVWNQQKLCKYLRLFTTVLDFVDLMIARRFIISFCRF